MSTPNELVCFTNCFLPQEDGSLIEKDLWIDGRRGVILDAQKTFFMVKERPDKVIDLGGNILSPGLIDMQINGAYGFDFSVFDGDDEAYKTSLQDVAERIVETGVTSFVPTLITQERSLYPKILRLLRPFTTATSATVLGWHAEGPFIDMAKRGAHAPSFLVSAPEGIKSFEELYGAENLADSEDWLMSSGSQSGVRIITAAPEVNGVMSTVGELTKRGLVFSIGHSIATSDIATSAVQHGARLITHLFNAMPQLHHRDPSIIGLLGASPHLYSPFSPITSKALYSGGVMSPIALTPMRFDSKTNMKSPVGSEALDEVETPPQTPMFKAHSSQGTSLKKTQSLAGFSLDSSEFTRPFYEMIVDGIHSHPNSVRLAYSAYPEGCILITDAMKILDPNLRDGVHEWRDGKRFVKEGDKLYLEGTDTLAGSVVTLDKCVRNFTRFTGCTLAESIKCATYNPAKCLGIETKKGTLRPGADADLVVFDAQGVVQSTWVKGKRVWGRN
ncbi:carbohydrate esterase family 9 protein [Lentinula aff. detonsa]|uniref:Carbohydrate esterase family 9 protein n=1 Tax=Lentinula aff. detonsa TaxID=2804958 RepID=A0AA38NJ16_9AGAR|nr:carbohydrate esterase family 9 protein [Lentinula aff. detonsa]